EEDLLRRKNLDRSRHHRLCCVSHQMLTGFYRYMTLTKPMTAIRHSAAAASIKATCFNLFTAEAPVMDWFGRSLVFIFHSFQHGS
ncbi:MAG: hypothetical protein N3B10_14045, partial [Armatimonadetes bacterium]|nr:hypothetical protein [Armatimonadota bacterium]